MAKIAAIVLAAGTSSRMGTENKLLMPWLNHTIIDEVIGSVQAAMPDEIVIVSSELTHDFLSSYQDAGFLLVENKAYRSGMTSSIQTGVNAASDVDGYMICLGDQPMIQREQYQEIMAAFRVEFDSNRDIIIVPYKGDQKGNPVIFSSNYKSEILNHVEPDGCRSIIQKHPDAVRKVIISGKEILEDIDTKEAYERLKSRYLDT